MNLWLVKTEPSECSIQDFARAPDQAIAWDGVRNFQARNYLRQMSVGDQVLLYHSSCRHIGIAGIVEVVREAYPDPTQFDAGSPGFDPKSRRDDPRWSAVDLRHVRTLPELLPLSELKTLEGLQDLPLVRKGNRLSVMPVTPQQWQIILTRAGS